MVARSFPVIYITYNGFAREQIRRGSACVETDDAVANKGIDDVS
jgi:hypothetical protein